LIRPHAGETEPRQPVIADDPAVLAERIRELRRPGRRVLVGIVGAPGSGKSTLAAAVLAELTDGTPPVRTALVPMDGYHLAQRVLDEAGLADIKGAPETFDAAGYIALLERLVSATNGSTEVVYAPEFRRALEEPIAGAVPVAADVEVVLTEGNYLLSTEPPWHRTVDLLTETWYLDVAEDLRLDRLISRHIAFGRTPEAAFIRASTGSDGRNAAYVRATRHRADLLVRPA
jgi:pantothenate kinase